MRSAIEGPRAIEDGHFLGAMQLAEAMGDTRGLDRCQQHYQRVARSTDLTVQAELDRLRSIREAWIKLEAEERPVSRRDLDRPLILQHAAIAIKGTEELENARRYRNGAKYQALVPAA